MTSLAYLNRLSTLLRQQAPILAGLGSLTLGYASYRSSSGASCCEEPVKCFYTAEQVYEQQWVTYQGKVYDVSDFIAQHPGGADRIHEALGGPIEPFWAYWGYHYQSPKPRDIMSGWKVVGYLVDGDGAGDGDHARSSEEKDAEEQLRQTFYEDEPARQETSMKVLTRRPFCSETVPSELTTLDTPQASLYVRNHAPVPRLDAKTHTIELQLDY